MGETGTYTTIKLGESLVGGILDMADARSRRGPAHWQVYFAVEDTDATIEAAKAAGGGVMVEPIDIPAGRFAILTDPHGASFAVIALSDEGAGETPRAEPEVGGRFGGAAGLALVLPFGGLAEAGALDDLEAEHRALHPRRRDLDPEQLEDELLRQPQQLLAASCRPARR